MSKASKTLRTAKALLVLAALFAVLLCTGCSGSNSGGTSGGSSDADSAKIDSILEEHKTGSMELQYADQFHVDYYEDGVAVVAIEDGLRYLVVQDSDKLPEWLPESAAEGMTVIYAPAGTVYNAASSAMDLIDAAGAIDSVAMTSTEAKDWAIEKIRKLVEHRTIEYIGKYRAPDYEALLEGDVDLAIESTMIYHSPQVKEEIESLGIPVLVERSSYEAEPLGRLEWIKLYGLLLGKSEQAEAFFNGAVDKLNDVDTDAVSEAPSVAFFSVNSNGSVVVRKPGDYVTKMIETAGGTYALDGITEEEDNALSTMNMQMEAFYDKAVDADILIYNSTIEGGLESISDLTALSEQFSDFKAVKSGNVWCTDASTFQRTTGAADMILEMNRMFAGAADDSNMEYFHKLK